MDGPKMKAEKGNSVRPSQRARYVFTWNNYPEDADGLLKTFYLHNCKALGRGLEVAPTTGTRHIQGWFWLLKEKRITALVKLLPGVHFEAMKCDLDVNREYCKKDNQYVEWNKTKPVNILKDEQLYDWQKGIIRMISDEPDDRKIYWYWEPNGNSGKSTFCKYLVVKHNAFILIGGAADMKAGLALQYNKTGTLPELIVLDLPRGIRSPDYTGIEQIKNGMFFNTKYESGMIVGNCPHLIVFANNPPATDRMSQDRWVITRLPDKNAETENEYEIEM